MFSVSAITWVLGSGSETSSVKTSQMSEFFEKSVKHTVFVINWFYRKTLNVSNP